MLLRAEARKMDLCSLYVDTDVMVGIPKKRETVLLIYGHNPE